jgi:hypothetical protein
MGFLQRLLRDEPSSPPPGRGAFDAASADEQAIARYRYLLRTAPPEAIEQAHAEAFAQLSPEQRAQVLEGLGNEVPPAERGAAANPTDPQALARMATRAEVRRPGTLERAFGDRGMGMGGMGGMFAGTLLSSIAGTFIGTAIAHQFLGGFGSDVDAAGAADDPDLAQDDAPGDEGANDVGDLGADDGGDIGGDFGDF